MSKAKQYNWVCPLCESTKRAPSKPRMNDTRRYCLACSESEGVLVERTCPVLDAKRERKAEAERARAAKKAARKKAQRETERAARKAAEKQQAKERADREARHAAIQAEQEREEQRRLREIESLDPESDPLADPNVAAFVAALEPWRKGTRWRIGQHHGAVVVPSVWEIPARSKLRRVRRLCCAIAKHPPGRRHGVRVTTIEPFLVKMTPTAFCDWAVAVLDELGELPNN